MGVWDVVPDGERLMWALDPFVSVGPLRFGTGPEGVIAALDGSRTPSARSYMAGEAGVRVERFDVGVTAYYADGDRLAGVSVDARKGPQVLAEGVPLVGRVPSVMEQWVIERAEVRDSRTELMYLPSADPGSLSLGVIFCLQRAGDVLITRPVFLAAEWLGDPYHCLPASALSVAV